MNLIIVYIISIIVCKDVFSFFRKFGLFEGDSLFWEDAYNQPGDWGHEQFANYLKYFYKKSILFIQILPLLTFFRKHCRKKLIVQLWWPPPGPLTILFFPEFIMCKKTSSIKYKKWTPNPCFLHSLPRGMKLDIRSHFKGDNKFFKVFPFFRWNSKAKTLIKAL